MGRSYCILFLKAREGGIGEGLGTDKLLGLRGRGDLRWRSELFKTGASKESEEARTQGIFGRKCCLSPIYIIGNVPKDISKSNEILCYQTKQAFYERDSRNRNAPADSCC